MPAITVIVNLHAEGRLCIPSIVSAQRACARAAEEGHDCEILVVVDRGSAQTLASLEPFASQIRVEHCDFGDPGEARNLGVEKAMGEFIAFIDGDDLVGSEWLVIAARTVLAKPNLEVVVHPRMNYVFGESIEPNIWKHPDMDEDIVDVSLLGAANLWTQLSFARAETYRKFKYVRSSHDAGLGYEDWAWNFETVRAGVIHLAPQGTIHFIRRKESGSQNMLAAERRSIPNFRISD